MIDPTKMTNAVALDMPPTGERNRRRETPAPKLKKLSRTAEFNALRNAVVVAGAHESCQADLESVFRALFEVPRGYNFENFASATDLLETICDEYGWDYYMRSHVRDEYGRSRVFVVAVETKTHRRINISRMHVSSRTRAVLVIACELLLYVRHAWTGNMEGGL